ncbi:Zn-dependent exopeptidase [Corynespora cassiicola Philippines]|uniref:Zn-dependent exopeptidase n=1 Tax=Corynespora cassiicola Philippines TaxID=1448308 RepID=A0A2T2NW95_CORCC|nr:Zn-dependent exopeptidase [Corynespora cassiicola Philippines]
MSKLTLSLPAFVYIALACQRDFPSLEPADQAILLAGQLAARQAEPFPPTWTKEEEILSNSFDGVEIETWSSYYTHGDHVAGRNRTIADETAKKWNANGIPTSIAEYEVYLNYPEKQELVLEYADGTRHVAQMYEDALDADETTRYASSLPAFHGYSASGEVEAEYVYVGQGHKDDFAALQQRGINVTGKIALTRYGGPFRGIKVKNAEANGMIGVVMFSDPGDDGLQEAKGQVAYPGGPARNPSSLQRGSVAYIDRYVGDPTTPGYPSKAGVARVSGASILPRIPSVPISYRDAAIILKALDGNGIAGKDMGRGGWVGGLNTTYSTGPAKGVKLSLANIMQDTTTPIWNVIGIINGTNANETIIVGNHRDAWIIGGAADPNSGSAIMEEITRAFGKLMSTGWKPRRNIVFASWDAEEYALVGSTEWVEEHAPWLSKTAISYLNIDIAVSGPLPGAAATPELRGVAQDVMKKVVYGNRTLYDAWHDMYQFRPQDNGFGDLGSGSDYTAFLQQGIGALDFGMGGGANDPVYHYHSNYDSFHWMKTFVDPDFSIHTTVGQYIGLLAYHLADDLLIPYDLNALARNLNYWIVELTMLTLQFSDSSSVQRAINLTTLINAYERFNSVATEYHKIILTKEFLDDNAKVASTNDKLKSLNKLFIKEGGLPGRSFYKNALYAPNRDDGYRAQIYPGTIEGLQDGNLTQAQEWNLFLADAVNKAAELMALA